MKKIYILLLLTFTFNLYLGAQTTSISGIINTYTSATMFPGCGLCSNCNQVSVTSVGGFSIGNKIMVIQMKGASINLNNSSTFGMIASYGSAGLYSFSTIVGIAGNTFTLSPGLSNFFDPSHAVQVVRVPVYTNAVVTAPITGLAWNGTIGGIIAFDVTNTLTLNSAIDASGLGFRGGLTTSNGFSYPSGLLDYYYGGIIQDNATQKGEGITVPQVGYELGRGAWANGGGGGNSHNGGGGGGSNGGIGGNGGNDYRTGTEPSGGRGGTSIDYTANTRVFLGGGGGAGHSNNNVGTNGGNGGGIVMISANAITGNNNFIRSNGQSALNTPGSGNDGAGGGGAGGSILLFTPTLATLNLQVIGGRGGNMTFSSGDHAPGGGGGGGVIMSSTTAFPVGVNATVSGGANGIMTINNTNLGATSGMPGLTKFNVTPPIPGPQTLPINLGSDVVLCNPASVTLDAGVTGTGFTYEWFRNNTLVSSGANPTFYVNAPGNYKVRVTAAGCVPGQDSLTISTQGATPSNVSFCAPPAALVSLSVTGTGRYKWWNASIGGNALGTGPTYASTLTSTSTFYVQDTATFSYGNFTPQSRLTGFNIRTGGSNTYMGFNATRAFRIDSINLFIRTYNTNNDFMTIRLRRRGNPTPLATRELGVTGPCNCTVDRNVQFALGFDVPVGNEYYLEYSTGSVNVHWDANSASYPYQVPGIINIYGPVDGSGAPIGWAPTSYGFFYNWKISAGIACARVPVVATLNCPLGVETIALSYQLEEKNVVLHWNVSHPLAFHQFELEYSSNGFDFESKQVFQNTSKTTEYAYVDHAHTAVRHKYYRVKAINLDGKAVYSNIVAIKTDSNVGIQAGPNPVSQEFVIKNVNHGPTARYEIYSLSGQLIHHTESHGYETKINTKNWSSGVYLLKYSNLQEQQVVKLVKE